MQCIMNENNKKPEGTGLNKKNSSSASRNSSHQRPVQHTQVMRNAAHNTAGEHKARSADDRTAVHTRSSASDIIHSTNRSGENHHSNVHNNSKKKYHKENKILAVLRKFITIILTTLLSLFLIMVITGTIVGTALTVYVLDFMEESTTGVTFQELEQGYNTYFYANDPDTGELVQLNVIEKTDVQRISVDIEDIPAEVLNAATVQSSPVLAPGDIIDISVVAKNQEVVIPFNKRLMQGEAYLRGNASKAVEYYLIDQAGNIDFPVIGRIHVAGKSKMEVEHLIQELLYPEYLNELPQVTVWIQNFSISVLGDVNRPGLFTIENERVSILDAIALAGDLAITGRRDNVLLVRVNSDGTKSIARINLNDKNLISSPYFYLQQNDVLYVQPNKSKANSAVVVPPTTSLIFSATSILLTIANLIITAWSISK